MDPAPFTPLQLLLLSNSVLSNLKRTHCLSPPHPCQPARYGFVAGNTVISQLAIHGHLRLGAFPERQPQQAVLLHRLQQEILLYTQSLPARDL